VFLLFKSFPFLRNQILLLATLTLFFPSQQYLKAQESESIVEYESTSSTFSRPVVVAGALAIAAIGAGIAIASNRSGHHHSSHSNDSSSSFTVIPGPPGPVGPRGPAGPIGPIGPAGAPFIFPLSTITSSIEFDFFLDPTASIINAIVTQPNQITEEQFITGGGVATFIYDPALAGSYVLTAELPNGITPGTAIGFINVIVPAGSGNIVSQYSITTPPIPTLVTISNQEYSVTYTIASPLPPS
jgi:hypothetical protein